jgi:hypothetical protein
MSTAFADKKGIPNDNSVADTGGWIVVCQPNFSVKSDTKELSNILLVFNDGTWEKFEIEDGILEFEYVYETATSPTVVTAFVKAGSYKTAKDPLYGNKKLGFEFNCDDPTDSGG